MTAGLISNILLEGCTLKLRDETKFITLINTSGPSIIADLKGKNNKGKILQFNNIYGNFYFMIGYDVDVSRIVIYNMKNKLIYDIYFTLFPNSNIKSRNNDIIINHNPDDGIIAFFTPGSWVKLNKKKQTTK